MSDRVDIDSLLANSSEKDLAALAKRLYPHIARLAGGSDRIERMVVESLRISTRMAELQGMMKSPGHIARLAQVFPDFPKETGFPVDFSMRCYWYKLQGFGGYVAHALSRASPHLDPIILSKLKEDEFLELGRQYKLSKTAWLQVTLWRQKNVDKFAELSRLESEG